MMPLIRSFLRKTLINVLVLFVLIGLANAFSVVFLLFATSGTAWQERDYFAEASSRLTLREAYRFVDRDHSGETDLLISFLEPTYRLVRWLSAPSVAKDDPVLTDTQPEDPRALLPNYEEPRYAAVFFKEFRELSTLYHPFVGWRRAPFRGRAITINESGYRVHPHRFSSDDSPPKRVGLFGGSTMWGTGVHDDETIPALVDALTEDAIVLNYGESGYTSRQSLAQLLTALSMEQDLDAAVFYDGVNEIYNCRNNGFIVSHAQVDTLRVRLEQPRVRRTQPCSADPHRARLVAANLLRNWDFARRIGSAQGIEVIAVLQPVAFVGDPRIDHLDPELLASRQPAEYAAIYPIIQELIAARDDPWIFDLSGALNSATEYFFIDWAHLSANGNGEIAELMVRMLRDRNVVAPAAPDTLHPAR